MNRNYFSTFGRRLRAMREEAGLTQLELIETIRRAGVEVGQTYISKLESSDRMPSLEVAAALAKVLDTTTDYLAMLTDDPLPLDGAEGPVYVHPETDKVAQIVDRLPREQRRQALVFAIEMLHRHRMDRRAGLMDVIAEHLESIRVEFGERAAEEIGLLLRPADGSGAATGDVDR